MRMCVLYIEKIERFGMLDQPPHIFLVAFLLNVQFPTISSPRNSVLLHFACDNSFALSCATLFIMPLFYVIYRSTCSTDLKTLRGSKAFLFRQACCVRYIMKIIKLTNQIFH
jgi:hypothetical protein